MKIPVVTDSHIDELNFELIESLFSELIDYCLTNNLLTIFHAGDWFKSRKGQSQAALLSTMRIIDKLRSAGVTMHIIPGNHDKTDLDANESFLDVFNCDSFKVISSPQIISFEGCDVAFLPFYKEEKYSNELNSIIKNIDEFCFEDSKKCLITHQGISGVKNNDGSSVDNSLKENLFDNFDLVVVGHYHNSQRFSNIYYIGSTHPATFGEDNEKGFVVLDTDTCETERHYLKFPKFTKLTIDIEQLTIEDINDLRLSKQEDGNNIRLIITGSSEALKTFDKTLLQEAGIDIKLESQEFDRSLQIADDNEYEVFNVDSIKSEFELFCKERNYDYNYGMQFLNKINPI